MCARSSSRILSGFSMLLEDSLDSAFQFYFQSKFQLLESLRGWIRACLAIELQNPRQPLESLPGQPQQCLPDPVPAPESFQSSDENALQIKRQSPFQVFSNLFETSPKILSRSRSRPRSSLSNLFQKAGTGSGCGSRMHSQGWPRRDSRGWNKLQKRIATILEEPSGNAEAATKQAQNATKHTRNRLRDPFRDPMLHDPR